MDGFKGKLKTKTHKLFTFKQIIESFEQVLYEANYIIEREPNRSEVYVVMWEGAHQEDIVDFISECVAKRAFCTDYDKAVAWLREEAGVPVVIVNSSKRCPLFIFGRDEDVLEERAAIEILPAPQEPRPLMLPRPNHEIKLG